MACVASWPPTLVYFFLFFLYLIFVCQVSTVLPTVATNTKPTGLSILDRKLQSSQVRGEKLGFSVSVCDVLWMATNCCVACQHVKPGALEREKWKINWCHLPRGSRDCDTWEAVVRKDGNAWETFQQTHWHVTLNYSITQALDVFPLYFFGVLQTM